ncbi:Sigma-70, region 4 [compost metagenome]
MERKVVFLHYMQGKSQEEVGKLIGKSQPTVSLYAKRAIDKMVDYINNWPEEDASCKQSASHKSA